MGWLDYAGALVQPTAGALRGVNAGNQVNYERGLADQDRLAKERLRVLQERLLGSQIAENNAQATKAGRGPQTPWEAAGFPDEASYLEHERRKTEATTRAPQPLQPTWKREGYPSFEAWRKDRNRSTNQAGAAQVRTNENDEAEGQAILNANLPEPLRSELSRSFRAARASGNKMSPGRLAKQVLEGLKRTRPDIFPRAAKEDPFGLFGTDPAVGGSTPGSGGVGQVPGAETPATPGPAVGRGPGGGVDRSSSSATTGTGGKSNPADRWEELVDGGMSEEDATAQVTREFNLP